MPLPFPLCCLAGALSSNAIATAAAASSGLVAGSKLAVATIVLPEYRKGSTAPVEGVIAGHQKLVSRSKVQHALAVSAIATAAAAAAGQRESHAAAPLALVAGLGTLAVAYSLLVMKPASRKIEASPLAPAAADAAKSSPKNCKDREQEEAKARDQLATFARMYSIRTGLALLSFGSAICGVLLLDKKKH